MTESLFCSRDWDNRVTPLLVREQWLRLRWCIPLGSFVKAEASWEMPLSSMKLQDRSSVA